jgi:hypothetical protein
MLTESAFRRASGPIAIRALAILTGAAIALTGARAAAQTAPAADQPSAASPPSWSGSASVFTYVVPDDENVVQPAVGLDREWLHLEARFNYEDVDTASAWVGRTFSAGTRLTLEITPMAGVVFGQLDGGAVGYTGSLTWSRLDLSSETEYVFAAGEGESFLYTWSELGWSLTDWLRAGLSVQRTKVYQTEFDIQRGFFGVVYLGRWELSTYVFNPDDTPTLVFGAALAF